MIEVENLTKRYARTTAVDGISFTVQKGEILGFLGPNGAGKTTTMRILTCFLPASAGTARVAGYDVFESPMEVKRRVGYIPETPPLYQDMTVRVFLDFVAKIKGIPAAARGKKIDEAMEKTRVGDVRDKLIAKLSRGYRQRVGLAQAIIHNPEVLILDEPTAGLDPKQIIETRELIKNLGGEHTIVLSTHILPEVSVTCGRVVIINNGRVVAEDTPDNLTQRLRGAATLKLEARGDQGSLFDVLRRIPGVTQIRPSSGHDDTVVYAIETEPGRDARGALARAVVEGGFELLGLGQRGMSLEDIFLHLTTSDDGSESSREAGSESGGDPSVPSPSVVPQDSAAEETSASAPSGDDAPHDDEGTK